MQSCVHSFFFFFARPTDPPTFTRGRAMRIETFYGDGLTRVEQAKTIAKESALEVEENKILAKKVGKYKEPGREEGEKIIVRNAGKQNETELE